jgi:ribosomal protein S18 acetylase RimI-like enzyme
MIKIVKATSSLINEYIEVFNNSELQSQYFAEKNVLKDFILEGIEQSEIHIATENDICVGVMRIDTHGAFGGFSFLRIIGVKAEYRNKGIGKKMLEYFEIIAAEQNKMAFLMVADFNCKAYKFYNKQGYTRLCEIENIYKDGVTEYLMMKIVK